ncbi:hypothetical protein MMC15_001802, partial [Xylographa vitiligo]|nr:hypothetical protein [Xylographa vitiligo]
GQRSLQKNPQNVAATIPSSAINHSLSTFPALPVNAATVEPCVATDELVLLTAAVVVATGTAPVPIGTYGVTRAVENEDVGLELPGLAVVVGAVLVGDEAVGEDVEEDEEEERDDGGEGPLEILKAAP